MATCAGFAPRQGCGSSRRMAPKAYHSALAVMAVTVAAAGLGQMRGEGGTEPRRQAGGQGVGRGLLAASDLGGEVGLRGHGSVLGSGGTRRGSPGPGCARPARRQGGGRHRGRPGGARRPPPVASMLSGPSSTTDVLPLSPEAKPATKPVLFKLMKSEGWETGAPLLPDGKLWAKTGRFDEEGHALGARLAERLSAGIRDAADRVLQLVRTGRSVRIVTDHGWLLMPGGLPSAALDVGLVEPNGKRTRCPRR